MTHPPIIIGMAHFGPKTESQKDSLHFWCFNKKTKNQQCLINRVRLRADTLGKRRQATKDHF